MSIYIICLTSLASSLLLALCRDAIWLTRVSRATAICAVTPSG